MNLGISKKLIFFSFFFINFIRPSQSADFIKINEKDSHQSTKLSWSKLPNSKDLLNSKLRFFNNNFEKSIIKEKLLEKNLQPLTAELSQKQGELEILSDTQSEKNNVIYAEGNVSVLYKGKLLKADKIVFDKLSKKISATGNITLFFGEQIFKMSQLDYNFKDKTGYLLDVKGSINSERLINDISSNFQNLDIQKLNDLKDIQKRSFKYSRKGS